MKTGVPEARAELHGPEDGVLLFANVILQDGIAQGGNGFRPGLLIHGHRHPSMLVIGKIYCPGKDWLIPSSQLLGLKRA